MLVWVHVVQICCESGAGAMIDGVAGELCSTAAPAEVGVECTPSNPLKALSANFRPAMPSDRK